MDRIYIGVSTHFAQKKGDLRVDIGAIKDAGFNSFRDEFYWESVESSLGSLRVPGPLYDYDESLTLFSGADFKPLLILSYGNRLYSSSGVPVDNVSRKAFARYSEFLANRYKGRVWGFEIWNEWNNGMGSRSGEKHKDVETYWELVKEVAPRLKAVDTSYQVIVGAVAGRDIEWIMRLVRMDGFLELADGLSVHPYNFCDGLKSRPEDVLDWLDYLDSNIQNVLGSSIPLHLTEIGWPTQKDSCGTNRELASAYVERMILLAPSRKYLKSLYFYNFRDKGLDIFNREHNFGFVEYNGNVKPALLGASQALSVLKAAEFLSYNRLDDLHVVTYALDSGDRVAGFWSKSGLQSKVRVRFSCNSDYKSDAISSELNFLLKSKHVGLSDGCAKLINVSASPVYVLGKFIRVEGVEYVK